MRRSMGRAAMTAILVCGVAPAQAIRAPFAVAQYFAPTGWMGDGSRGTLVIKIDENYAGKPRPGDDDGKCMRISWAPRTAAWAGMYWQTPAGNWGMAPGKSVVGATRVTFWAAGETGTEVLEFKAGGLRTMTLPYKDSFAVTRRAVKLTTGWQQYEISLKGQNLTSVIGAFAWVAQRANNVGAVTFYLDGIEYQ